MSCEQFLSNPLTFLQRVMKLYIASAGFAFANLILVMNIDSNNQIDGTLEVLLIFLAAQWLADAIFIFQSSLTMNNALDNLYVKPEKGSTEPVVWGETPKNRMREFYRMYKHRHPWILVCTAIYLVMILVLVSQSMLSPKISILAIGLACLWMVNGFIVQFSVFR